MLKASLLTFLIALPLANAAEDNVVKIFADRVSAEGNLEGVKVATNHGFITSSGSAVFSSVLQGITTYRLQLSFKECTVGTEEQPDGLQVSSGNSMSVSLNWTQPVLIVVGDRATYRGFIRADGDRIDVKDGRLFLKKKDGLAQETTPETMPELLTMIRNNAAQTDSPEAGKK